MNHIIKDPWTWIITVMTIGVQWVMAHFNFIIGVMMGMGGLITLVFRTKAEMKKNKILDVQLKKEEEELRILKKQ